MSVALCLSIAACGGGGSGGRGGGDNGNQGADVTPPAISASSPSGALSAGTTSTTLSVTTNETATCRYSTTAGSEYSAMVNNFSTSNGTAHSANVSGLTNGTAYNYYVRCRDSAGNINSSDHTIAFTVATSSTDAAPPAISAGSPSGALPAGTTSTTLSITTNETATCRYSTTAGSEYSAMVNNFSTSNGTAHAANVSGLTNGTAYIYYVRCRDSVGNINSSDAMIAFAVAKPAASAWPDATNTGYRNAPGYPGSLTQFTGTVQSGQTYRFHDFPDGFSISAGVSNVTFYGCRFRSNALADANVSVYGDNITFDYSSFEPSVVSAPPAAYNQGYQYGIDQRGAVRITVDHSDFWGFGNGIQFGFSSQAKPFVVRNSWFHDARDDGGIDHTDGILSNDGGPDVQYMVFDHNTIVSVGNTQGLALQGSTGYSNVTVTNNYFSGFGYTVSLGANGGANTNSNVVFTDNVFGTDIKPDWGPFFGNWADGHGNLWRRNRWKVVRGSYYTNVADDGKYWWPDETLSTTDYSQ